MELVKLVSLTLDQMKTIRNVSLTIAPQTSIYSKMVHVKHVALILTLCFILVKNNLLVKKQAVTEATKLWLILIDVRSVKITLIQMIWGQVVYLSNVTQKESFFSPLENVIPATNTPTQVLMELAVSSTNVITQPKF